MPFLMQQAYTADQRIPDQNLENRFEKLIVGPVQTLKQPMIIIVDGIDEINGQDGLSKLIEIIVKTLILSTG